MHRMICSHVDLSIFSCRQHQQTQNRFHLDLTDVGPSPHLIPYDPSQDPGSCTNRCLHLGVSDRHLKSLGLGVPPR